MQACQMHNHGSDGPHRRGWKMRWTDRLNSTQRQPCITIPATFVKTWRSLPPLRSVIFHGLANCSPGIFSVIFMVLHFPAIVFFSWFRHFQTQPPVLFWRWTRTVQPMELAFVQSPGSSVWNTLPDYLKDPILSLTRLNTIFFKVSVCFLQC